MKQTSIRFHEYLAGSFIDRRKVHRLQSVLAKELLLMISQKKKKTH